MKNYAIIKDGEILKILYDQEKIPDLPKIFKEKNVDLVECPKYISNHWNYDYNTKQFYEFAIPIIQEDKIIKKIFNLYNLYQYNIWHLINDYNLDYYWIDIQKEDFYNGMWRASFNDFSETRNDPWLNKYSKSHNQLGENILDVGTFTPFFYQENRGKKYILLGRHRLYSLKSLNKNLNRKFLFIRVPHTNNNEIKYKNKKLWFFSFDNPDPYLTDQIQTNNLLFNLLINTGDFLTPYLWKNNCIPFKPFNNEQSFKEWINNPLEGE